MPKVSDAHKQAVRQGILDAATRVIERSGPSALTTRAIIDEAGISNGTLYHYFPSIDHLFAELAEIGLRNAMAGLIGPPIDPSESSGDGGTGAAAPGGAGGVGAAEAERLVAWLRRDILGDRELAGALAGFRSRIELGAVQRDAVEGLNREAVASIGDLVRGLQARGSLRTDLDADALVEMVDFLWDGLGRRHAAGTFQTSYERVVATIAQVLLTGIVAADPPG